MFIENDGFFKVDTGYWFIGRNDDVLYKLNESMECTPVAFLSDEEKDVYRYHQKCVVYDNKVFCLPDRANYIAVYDIVEDSLIKLSIPKGDNHRLSILYAYIEDDSLYCVSSGTGSIFEVSITDCRIKAEYEVFDKRDVGADEFSCDKSLRLDGNIFFVSNCEPVIAIFDIRTKETKKIVINIKDKGFNTITYVNGTFLLTGYKENIYVWNGKSEEITTFSLNINDLYCMGYKNDYSFPLFFDSCSMRNKALYTLFYQQFGKGLLIIDLENGLTVSVVKDDKNYKYGDHYVIESMNDRETIVFFDGDDFARYLIVDKLQWGAILCMKKKRPKEAILNRMNLEMGRTILNECSIFDLNDFLYLTSNL